jgi:hypothetical protein
MDTFREMQLLNEMWSSGKAPWRSWPDKESIACRKSA